MPPQTSNEHEVEVEEIDQEAEAALLEERARLRRAYLSEYPASRSEDEDE